MRPHLMFAAALALAGCVQNTEAVRSTKDPAELAAMQARTFATQDRNQALRQVIFTLEDNGYGIDSVNAQEGSLSAVKGSELTLNATVEPAPNGTTIRADALIHLGTARYEVDDPSFYADDFFNPLSRSLALASAGAPSSAVAPAYAQPAPAQEDPGAPSTQPWHATPSP